MQERHERGSAREIGPFRIERGREEKDPSLAPDRLDDCRFPVVKARQDSGVRGDPGKAPIAEEGEAAEPRGASLPKGLEDRMSGGKIPESPGWIAVHELSRHRRRKRLEFGDCGPRETARSHRHHQASPLLHEFSDRAHGARVEAPGITDERDPASFQRAPHRPFSAYGSSGEKKTGSNADSQRFPDVNRRRTPSEIGDPNGGLRMDQEVETVITREGVLRKPHLGREGFARTQDRRKPCGSQPIGRDRQTLPVHRPARKQEFHFAVPFRPPVGWSEAHLGGHHQLIPPGGRNRHLGDPGIRRRCPAHLSNPEFDAGRQAGLRPAIFETAPLEIGDQHHFPAPSRGRRQEPAREAERRHETRPSASG